MSRPFERIENVSTEDNRKILKCRSCGYGWKSRGKTVRVTCPNCQLKTRNEQVII